MIVVKNHFFKNSFLKKFYKNLPIDKAINFVKEQGKVHYFFEDQPFQMLPENSKFKKILMEKTSSHINWRYVTGKSIFDHSEFKAGFDVNKLILFIILTDTRIHRIIQPTLESFVGEDYMFLIGNKEHVKQVIAHDSETYRYLNFLENRLRYIRDDNVK